MKTRTWILLNLAWFFVGGLHAADITSPQQQFGFNLGDDYQLANYRMLTEYWKQLEQESDRIKLQEIGRSAEGRVMLMAIITSPSNQQNLSRYRQISRRLALAEDLAPDEAHLLASEGKAVVWIDGGLHATEVLGAQQLMELVYQMASREDSETLRILDDVILLAACANPDGLDLVADWYMQNPEPEKRSTRGIPRLYQKYAGHDNNRDFYLVSQPETEAMSRILYREWYPQIAYNHHQTGPAGTVMFAPPFRDPFNYNIDPLIITSLDLVGAAMHNRFVAENKPGTTMRHGAGYSTWWNGGLRTTQYFHNIIGLLTETIGHPTPMEIPLVLERQLPDGNLPYPIEPQKWHFRQSIDYSITANRAVLDVASKYREDFLFNVYQMGRKSIERGNRDHWTVTAERISAVETAYLADNKEIEQPRRARLPRRYFEDMLRDPARRDPRGYILPADQPDFPTAGKFVNALIKSGISVQVAERDFQVEEKSYPPGSYVVKTAQAYRPHILDLFEPQHHPNDFPYPGGPPTAPYDSAGWTLALQMGVSFDRILEGFEGPFEELADVVSPPAGSLTGAGPAAGYLYAPQLNNSSIVTNRLLREGARIWRLAESHRTDRRSYPPGAFFVVDTEEVRPLLETAARELGLDFEGLASPPEVKRFELRPARIALWDRYGGSMPSGWLRWILEQYEFPFEIVYPPQLDGEDLIGRYDVLVFAGGAIPRVEDRSGGRFSRRRDSSPPRESIPAEYHDMLGSVTLEKTAPQLNGFLQAGGSILAIGSSTDLVYHLNLPLTDPLREADRQGQLQPLPQEKYYVPGSVLQAKVDNRQPLAYGLPEEVNFYFNNSPVFQLTPEAAGQGVQSVAWFDNAAPLRSGWAWGQHYLNNTIAVVEVPVGKGLLVLYGPEITFRAQPHGTFKFLFNGLWRRSEE